MKPRKSSCVSCVGNPERICTVTSEMRGQHCVHMVPLSVILGDDPDARDDARAGVAERLLSEPRALSLSTCRDDSLILQLPPLFTEHAAV